MKRKLYGVLAAVVLSTGVLFPAQGEAALGDQTLKTGTSHQDVKELQDYLMAKGDFPYHESTGYFGPITDKAVEDFQSTNKLKVDGIAGPQTNHKIKVLRTGDIGKPVAELQRLLKA
ncbi:peptidoglycan-binding protein [Metabacillus herbersteinensis]|uniref:Peptidoglycan-binding protein n=1 Tax=Metabacillus herbersteinensis TaxID=283816 RepID=A0ABV6GCD3_9BACI